MSTITLNLPPVTRYQSKAIFSPERFAIIEATTKAGKTWGCICWLMMMGGNGNGGEYWWVAPVFEQAEIAYRRMKKALGAELEGKLWTTNAAKLTITLTNGSVFRFKSADNPDSLYGEDVRAAVFDEASRAKEEAWHALRSTLTATKGPCRIIGNVKGRRNWAYVLARKVEGGTLPEWRYAKITCADAVREGVIEQAEIDAAKRELPESVFRELYYAEASEDGANPFGMSHLRACEAALSDTEPVAFGIDLARKQDWTVVVGLDEHKRPCRFDRWHQLPWGETIRRIAALVGDTPALADATGVGDPVVEELQSHCSQLEGFLFTSKSKQAIMERLAVDVQQHLIGVPEGVTMTECESFEYQVTRTGVRYSAPDGLHDDCVCALALANECAGERAEYSASVVSHSQVKVNMPEVTDHARRFMMALDVDKD